MELDYEALHHAQRARSVFEGIRDSFGARMCADVSKGVIADLMRNRNGREECLAGMTDAMAMLERTQEMMQS